MTYFKLAGTTAAFALMTGQFAWAAVTPEDVWMTWQNQAVAVGQKVVTETVTRDGDTLIITGLKAQSAIDGVTTETVYGELRLKDLGDGTVEVLLPSNVTTSSTVPPQDGLPGETITATISAPGIRGIASGEPSATTYDFTVPEVTMDMTVLADAGQPGSIVMTMSSASTRYIVSGPAEAMTFDGSFSAASVGMKVSFAEADGAGSASLSFSDVAGTGKGNLAGMKDGGDVALALRNGLNIESNLTYGASTFDFSVPDSSEPGTIAGSSEGGKLIFAMGQAGLVMETGAQNVQLLLSGMGMPFPEAKLGYSESGFRFGMPLSKSDTPANYSLVMKLVDLTVSDEIWGMIDPMGKLPHDPATVVVDTSGTATLAVDMTDEAALAALGDLPPGSLNTFNLNNLTVKLAGAELTGAGAFSFDNADMTTFGGVPAPTGKADFKLTGGNALLDKLVEMGMLSADDVMGYRMMLTMFANTSPDKDEMTSTIEAKDKHLYVNGQMIQ